MTWSPGRPRALRRYSLGGAADASVLIFPAFWLSQYFLFVYLFGRNVLFLLGTHRAARSGQRLRLAAHRARAVFRLRGDEDARLRHWKRPRLPVVSVVAGTAANRLPLRRCHHRHPSAPLHSLERQFILLVPAQVLLLLVLARLPGELGVLDFFRFAGGVFPGLGSAPSSHPASNYPDFTLATPAVELVRQLAVMLGLTPDAHIRFVLLPFALLLLAAVVRKPTWPRMAALAAVVAAQTVVSPKTTIFVPACLVVFGLYEARARARRAGAW
jgi:hypothetical protein